ncbi:hypothetical protein ABKV19_020680 [Rosa sericea]
MKQQMYAGSTWDELEHIRQAIGFLANAHFSFGPLCQYLSVRYLDRFLLAFENTLCRMAKFGLCNSWLWHVCPLWPIWRRLMSHSPLIYRWPGQNMYSRL